MTEPDVQALIDQLRTGRKAGSHMLVSVNDWTRSIADALDAHRAEIARLRTAAEDMRERAAGWHIEVAQKLKVARDQIGAESHYGFARAIRALPVDGGE